ncbi:MAG TPA: hypothetical protein VKA43_14475, partial [Gammaproteobacteria bacterium]|nr:hypothetical protein [Gammaproteobacteria bacterium]
MSAARRSFARRWLYGVALAALVGGASTVQQPAWAQLLPLPPLLPPPEPEPPPPEPEPEAPPPVVKGTQMLVPPEEPPPTIAPPSTNEQAVNPE